MFFANITGGKSAAIIAFTATILQNIFQNILYLQHENFWGHVEKGNAYYYTFSVFNANKCQTLYSSMNTSYQFSDLITTIVSNN